MILMFKVGFFVLFSFFRPPTPPPKRATLLHLHNPSPGLEFPQERLGKILCMVGWLVGQLFCVSIYGVDSWLSS